VSDLSDFARQKAKLDAMTTEEAIADLDRLIKGLEEDAACFGETLHDKKIMMQYRHWRKEFLAKLEVRS
jgi:hypothetical protein